MPALSAVHAGDRGTAQRPGMGPVRWEGARQGYLRRAVWLQPSTRTVRKEKPHSDQKGQLCVRTRSCGSAHGTHTPI